MSKKKKTTILHMYFEVGYQTWSIGMEAQAPRHMTHSMGRWYIGVNRQRDSHVLLPFLFLLSSLSPRNISHYNIVLENCFKWNMYVHIPQFISLVMHPIPIAAGEPGTWHIDVNQCHSGLNIGCQTTVQSTSNDTRCTPGWIVRRSTEYEVQLKIY